MLKERPIGISVLAILTAIEGIIVLVTGILLAILGLLVCFVGIFALVVLIIGAALIYLAKGLWNLEEWAWVWTLILQLLNLPIILWNLFVDASDPWTLVQAAIFLLVVIYLFIVMDEFKSSTRRPTKYESYSDDVDVNELFPGRAPVPGQTMQRPVVAGVPYCPKCRATKFRMYIDESGYCEGCGTAFKNSNDLPRG
ncbi:MAG: hypothetical protein V1934_05430 [Methanobacteriota archaeon]